MSVISIILFALCANLDNVVIGISYGIKKIKIGIFPNIVIALLTTIGTCMAMFLGKSIFLVLPMTVTKLVGSFTLIIIALYYLLKYIYIEFYKKEKIQWPTQSPAKFDKDKSGDIDIKEASLLAITLTINNLALGIGIGITKIPILISSIIIFIFSFVTLYIGNLLGNNYLSKILGKYAEPISGCIILLLGIAQLFL